MAVASVRQILLPFFRHHFDEISGQENLPLHGPYILATNHIDFLDGFYIAAAAYDTRHHDVFFITKTRNYWWTQATIAINPDNKADSLRVAGDFLSQGKVICNFVEGERNSTGRLLPAKSGTARLALATGVPVVPVGIRGPSGKTFIQSVRLAMTERQNVTVRFGSALAFTKDDSVEEATAKIMSAIAPLCGKVFVR